MDALAVYFHLKLAVRGANYRYLPTIVVWKQT